MKLKANEFTAVKSMILAVVLVLLGVAGVVKYSGGSGSTSNPPTVLEKQVSNSVKENSNEDSGSTTEHNDSVSVDHPATDSGGTGQDGALDTEPAELIPPVGHCNLVMVGYTTGYSELSTPLNTIRMTEAICVDIAHSLAMYRSLGIVSADDVHLPPFLRK
jgi:hypothetical protein